MKGRKKKGGERKGRSKEGWKGEGKTGKRKKVTETGKKRRKGDGTEEEDSIGLH